MSLEELIKIQISSNADMAGQLATYGEDAAPAIFFGIAPDDTMDNWSVSQYPRIVYTIQMIADRKRDTAGTLSVTVLCDDSGLMPEDIVPLLKTTMKDLVLTPDDGTSSYCFAWNATNVYEVPKTTGQTNSGERIVMDVVDFDIYEYTSQTTTAPDPIQALNLFLKKIVPSAKVFGADEMAPIFVTTNQEPFIYAELQSAEPEKEAWAFTLMDAKIAIHVLTPDSDYRIKYASSVLTELLVVNRLWLEDTSPMLIQKQQINYNADPLTTGQVTLTAVYSVPRRMEYITPLINTNHKDDLEGDSMEENTSTEVRSNAGIYSVQDISRNADRLYEGKYTPDIITAAMRRAKLEKATLDQAEAVIKAFLG